MTARTARIGLGIAALAVALVGCASTPATTGGTSTAPSDDELTEIEVDAAWLDEGRMIGLVTWGSSSCVPTAGETAMLDNGALVVELIEVEGDAPCTADQAPRVTLVGVPEAVDPTQDLEIEVTGEGIVGDTDLDGVPGLDPTNTAAEYMPSAGWTDEDGVFALLTWGSSTCAPVISAVTPTAADEVTVTFETPPADQVCTMDMAPRATLAFVEGLEAEDSVTAVLDGDEFAGARIPIYGSN
jgi:hypothetical protein